MTSPPLFSVIVPTRDRPALLARALRSVLAQEGARFEVIVADDGDGTGAAAAETLMGDDVVAFRTGGLGQVPARNMALARAGGTLVAFLDDDDWWATPDHLARLAAAAAGHVAYASGRIVREGGGAESDIPFRAHTDALRRDSTLLVSGIAYPRALHDRLGPLDESLTVYWDWDWYLRLAAAGVAFIDGGGAGVRISVREGTASSAANLADRQLELARLSTKHGLRDIILKNHESIAVEQQSASRI